MQNTFSSQIIPSLLRPWEAQPGPQGLSRVDGTPPHLTTARAVLAYLNGATHGQTKTGTSALVGQTATTIGVTGWKCPQWELGHRLWVFATFAHETAERLGDRSPPSAAMGAGTRPRGRTAQSQRSPPGVDRAACPCGSEGGRHRRVGVVAVKNL